ncbi:MAG: hypothetical protein R3261_03310, partial [Alphaproteobacteria bacterium]|nr:hypothetical protein [Alphaproteobacteria bacterium]
GYPNVCKSIVRGHIRGRKERAKILMDREVPLPDAFEVFMDNIPVPKNKGGKARPMLVTSALQHVNRDFAFTVKDDVSAEKLVRAALGADKKLISDVKVFDVYKGDDMGDEKSIAITVTMQPTDKTLTDEDIEAVSQKIINMVSKGTGGSLRA